MRRQPGKPLERSEKVVRAQTCLSRQVPKRDRRAGIAVNYPHGARHTRLRARRTRQRRRVAAGELHGLRSQLDAQLLPRKLKSFHQYIDTARLPEVMGRR